MILLLLATCNGPVALFKGTIAQSQSPQIVQEIQRLSDNMSSFHSKLYKPNDDSTGNCSGYLLCPPDMDSISAAVCVWGWGEWRGLGGVPCPGFDRGALQNNA
ncbi:hypothetical protein ACLKA7_001211 [Drosophila subpalustris]